MTGLRGRLVLALASATAAIERLRSDVAAPIDHARRRGLSWRGSRAARIRARDSSRACFPIVILTCWSAPHHRDRRGGVAGAAPLGGRCCRVRATRFPHAAPSTHVHLNEISRVVMGRDGRSVLHGYASPICCASARWPRRRGARLSAGPPWRGRRRAGVLASRPQRALHAALDPRSFYRWSTTAATKRSRGRVHPVRAVARRTNTSSCAACRGAGAGILVLKPVRARWVRNRGGARRRGDRSCARRREISREGFLYHAAGIIAGLYSRAGKSARDGGGGRMRTRVAVSARRRPDCA